MVGLMIAIDPRLGDGSGAARESLEIEDIHLVVPVQTDKVENHELVDETLETEDTHLVAPV